MLDAVTLQGRYVRLEPLSAAHVPALLAVGRAARETFGLTFVPSDEASMHH
jgi:hypothetical protein